MFSHSCGALLLAITKVDILVLNNGDWGHMPVIINKKLLKMYDLDVVSAPARTSA